ncbi:MAG TPA: hypothetical protein VKY45_08810 [Marinilabiliaceae bacterium]|nr:hypothetical protein [Marinilabiliaceae bacterium]
MLIVIVIIAIAGAFVFVDAKDIKVIQAEQGRVIDVSLAAQERYKQWVILFDRWVKGEIKKT